MTMRRKAKQHDAGTQQVSFRLPSELVRQLDELAEKERRTRTSAAAVLLERALADARRAG